MWSNKTPDLISFTCAVKPQQYLDPYFVRKNKKELVGDVFVGSVGKLVTIFMIINDGWETNMITDNIICVDGGMGDNVGRTSGVAGTSTPPPTPEHAKAGFSTNLVLEEEVSLK
jgi:hypothetical protein